MAQVLSAVDNGDGTHTVTVATVTYGQAVVTVPTAALDAPETQQLYDHVADMGRNALTAVRRSGRDRRRIGND